MQRVIPIDSPCFLPQEELPSPPDWQALFGNNHPLALEIGCGIGDFLVQEAMQHPELNFIAVDYYNQGCLKSCRRLERHGLQNVRVLRAEAREFMVSFLPKLSLQRVYINCPDPWPKKRHRKRRLVNAAFMAFLADYLKPGGDFFFATDFDDYGIDVANMMAQQAGYENSLAPDLYRHELVDYPISKYMRRFLDEGKQIYFIHYGRRV
jgi:tRNA (guanine-N7-)-methyltransferase